jgi:hypothetical protein
MREGRRLLEECRVQHTYLHVMMTGWILGIKNLRPPQAFNKKTRTYQRSASADMPQELMAQAQAFMRALQQPRHVSKHCGFVVLSAHSQVRDLQQIVRRTYGSMCVHVCLRPVCFAENKKLLVSRRQYEMGYN